MPIALSFDDAIGERKSKNIFFYPATRMGAMCSAEVVFIGQDSLTEPNSLQAGFEFSFYFS